MSAIKAYAIEEQGKPLTPFEYDPGELGPEQVEIAVEYCGVCHSDLSMIKNEWHMTAYPLVPGHEVVGKVIAAGEHVKNVSVGQRVGLGWFSGSCMHCLPCLSGDHNSCVGGEQTIVGRHGGFADRVRCHWVWAAPLPEQMDPAKAGPLFCGGITVFSPIARLGVQPTDRVGVIGIGGLGHFAIQFLNKWGCEVTAFTSSQSKAEQAKKMGAHHVVNSRDDAAMEKLQWSQNFILNTTNANLNWEAYVAALAPNGRLHHVGAVPEPIGVNAFSLIMGQRSMSGTGLGSPAIIQKMLEFCVRHDIETISEEFDMTDVNDAMEHLEAGKARYRLVLKNNL